MVKNETCYSKINASFNKKNIYYNKFNLFKIKYCCKFCASLLYKNRHTQNKIYKIDMDRQDETHTLSFGIHPFEFST